MLRSGERRDLVSNQFGYKQSLFPISVAALCFCGCAETPESEQPVEVIEHFSQSYQEARTNFLRACKAIGASVDHYENPHKGPEGQPLSTDVAALGPKSASRALVLNSGTHGVEGFCGSGLQTALLHDGLTDRLPEDVRLLVIHAINPYGFAWIRRFNEENVDLNRNFVDHSEPYPDNPGYEALADAIAPKDYSVATAQQAKATLFQYADKHGLLALQHAVSSGQYTHLDGLHYGGNSETWSNRTFGLILKKHLSTAKQVVFIDFHTGLGDYGKGECILSNSPDSPAFQRARLWWGDRARSTLTGESVSARIYGSLKSGISQSIPDAELTATSLELGTFDLLEVFSAMQAENWLHIHGAADDPRREAIKAELLSVFYPDDDEWKKMVWNEAKEVVDQALTGLAGRE